MEQFPREPNPEDIERDIETLLEKLEGYSEYWDEFPDLQDDWYYVDMEGQTGKDREQAKARLEEFIGRLEKRISEKNP